VSSEQRDNRFPESKRGQEGSPRRGSDDEDRPVKKAERQTLFDGGKGVRTCLKGKGEDWQHEPETSEGSGLSDTTMTELLNRQAGKGGGRTGENRALSACEK